eukprot:3677870-Pyramimonas_sp.AAC.1
MAMTEVVPAAAEALQGPLPPLTRGDSVGVAGAAGCDAALAAASATRPLADRGKSTIAPPFSSLGLGSLGNLAISAGVHFAAPLAVSPPEMPPCIRLPASWS